MNNKHYHYFGTVPKSNRKIIEREAKWIPLTYIHAHSLSWLDNGSSI
jgi:hypothetical protein